MYVHNIANPTSFIARVFKGNCSIFWTAIIGVWYLICSIKCIDDIIQLWKSNCFWNQNGFRVHKISFYKINKICIKKVLQKAILLYVTFLILRIFTLSYINRFLIFFYWKPQTNCKIVLNPYASSILNYYFWCTYNL